VPVSRPSRIILGAVVALLLIGLSFALYFFETLHRQSVVVSVVESPNRMEIAGEVVSVDLNRYEMTVRLNFAPKGNLLSTDGRTLARDLTLSANAATGPTDRQFQRGRPANPTDVVLSLFDGEVSDFPFDIHKGELQLFLTTGADASQERVPFSISLVAGVQGLVIDAESDRETPDLLTVDFVVSRSNTTIGFALLIMAMMWGLALVALALTWAITFTDRRIEATTFSWLGAMLFAFPALRSVAPGAPPIGALSDYLAFFWAESIVAICLIVTISVYVSRPLPK
jgi:hypothetical protein